MNVEEIRERWEKAAPLVPVDCGADIVFLLAELARKDAALAFYADEANWENWTPPGEPVGIPPARIRYEQTLPVLQDDGRRARAALGGTP